MEASWTFKTLIICVKGCKNQVFGFVGFWTILGSILEVILELKMNPKSHCDSLWAPSVAILTLLRGVEKSIEKQTWKKVMQEEKRSCGYPPCPPLKEQSQDCQQGQGIRDTPLVPGGTVADLRGGDVEARDPRVRDLWVLTQTHLVSA